MRQSSPQRGIRRLGITAGKTVKETEPAHEAGHKTPTGTQAPARNRGELCEDPAMELYILMEARQVDNPALSPGVEARRPSPNPGSASSRRALRSLLQLLTGADPAHHRAQGFPHHFDLALGIASGKGIVNRPPGLVLEYPFARELAPLDFT